MPEQWEVFDINRIQTGKIVNRGCSLGNDEFHLVVHVWIKANDHQYVISKRSMKKDYAPGLWETPGGCVQLKEASIDAAIREVKEEIGITLKKENGKCLFKTIGIDTKRHLFIDVWQFVQNIDIENIQVQKEEVEKTILMTVEEVKTLIKNNKFMPDCKIYADTLFTEK
jgi:8-oxo-dGTP diphosphatase